MANTYAKKNLCCFIFNTNEIAFNMPLRCIIGCIVLLYLSCDVLLFYIDVKFKKSWKKEANRVPGCMSTVYIKADYAGG